MNTSLKTIKIDYENLAKLNKPFIEEYKTSFNKTLDAGWFILGKNVESFEEEFADYLVLITVLVLGMVLTLLLYP